MQVMNQQVTCITGCSGCPERSLKLLLQPCLGRKRPSIVASMQDESGTMSRGMLSAGLDDGERAPRAAGQSLGFFWDLGMWVAGLPHRDVTVVISTPTLRMLPVVLCAVFFDRALKAATEELPPEAGARTV